MATAMWRMNGAGEKMSGAALLLLGALLLNSEYPTPSLSLSLSPSLSLSVPGWRLSSLWSVPASPFSLQGGEQGLWWSWSHAGRLAWL